MKEMPIFEEVFTRLLAQPRLWVKLLIGGLLCSIPVANFLAFGYLARMSRHVRERGSLHLPEWSDWQGLFFDGLRFTVVLVLYWLVPLIGVGLVVGFFALLGLEVFAVVLSATGFLAANLLFAAALYRFQTRGRLEDLGELRLIVKMAFFQLSRIAVPSLVVLGLSVLLLPFYGFAFFTAFLVLLAYHSLRFRTLEKRPSVAL